jgi:hypothetical protein
MLTVPSAVASMSKKCSEITQSAMRYHYRYFYDNMYDLSVILWTTTQFIQNTTENAIIVPADTVDFFIDVSRTLHLCRLTVLKMLD